jgi:nitrogen fixation protein FixH
MMAVSLQPTADGGRSRWIPWTFVGFFVVVFAVNGIMIWLALSSWTGLEADNSYERGLIYNRAIEAEKEQAALGWRAAFRFVQTGARRGRLELSLQGRDGARLEGARIDALVVRPTREGFDFDLALAEREPGRYLAEVGLPLPGQWEVRLAARANGEIYRLSPRIYLKP